MIKQYFVQRKIKKFIVRMSQSLAADYGRSTEYTEGQVKTVLKKLKYSLSLEEVAIGIFCNAKVASAYGMNEALIRKYRSYSRQNGIDTDGGFARGFSGDGGSSD